MIFHKLKFFNSGLFRIGVSNLTEGNWCRHCKCSGTNWGHGVPSSIRWIGERLPSNGCHLSLGGCDCSLNSLHTSLPI